MRLRRENGDFDFIIKSGSTTTTIQPNLFPEQLVGQIIIYANIHTVITTVEGANGAATYRLTTANGQPFTYTVATGEVTPATVEQPAG